MLPEIGFVAAVVGAGDDDDAVFPRIVDCDHSHTGGLGVAVADAGQVNTGVFQAFVQKLPQAVPAEDAEEGAVAAQLSAGAGLIRSLSAGDVGEGTAQKRFPLPGHFWHVQYEINVGTSDYQDFLSLLH